MSIELSRPKETYMFKNSLEFISLKKRGIRDFAGERNELLRKSKADWVFFVDPDEVITPELRKEIREAVKNPKVNGYFVVRHDMLFGRKLTHGEFSTRGWFGTGRLLRLARRNAGRWQRAVHEVWKIKGQTGILKNPLLHYPHPTLKGFIGNINYFSTLHAVSLKEEGKSSGLIKIAVWPPGKFVYNYFFRLGFLDGMPGFMAALMMSFHSFLSWSKLYFLYS